MKIGGHEIDVSHRDKVFFPDAGLTKGDLIDYYAQVASVMVPHMKRYGVAMQRFPDGLEGQGFYQKETPDYFPSWIRTVTIPKREGGSFDAPIVDSKAALVYLLDMLRNAYGATAVSPYAVRARPGAPVATPLDWPEVEGGASPRDWTVQNLPDRLAQKADPWMGLMRHARSLSSHRARLEDLLAQEAPAAEEAD